MDTPIKTPMMNIRLRVVGIAKRQRTVKVHNIDVITDLPYEDIDLNQYVSQALMIRDKSMRTVESCSLYLSPWTKIDYPSEGYSMKEITFADKRYKAVKL